MKYTYIQKDLTEGFLELDYELDPSMYQVGTLWVNYMNGLWVQLTEEQIAFKEANPNASVKEVFDMQLTPAYQPTLEDAKRDKIAEIEAYDKSEAVNSFTINGVTAWFDKEKRGEYFRSIDSAKAMGRPTVSFFFGEQLIAIPVDMAYQMMNQLQLYANDSYNVTESHKIAVNKLQTIEAVEAYDYKANYPERLQFNIGETYYA